MVDRAKSHLAAAGGHGRPWHALVPVEADIGAVTTLLRKQEQLFSAQKHRRSGRCCQPLLGCAARNASMGTRTALHV